MHRGYRENRGNWKRPHHNEGLGRPKGLRGKAIGLYYKNKQQTEGTKNKKLRLEIPETVLAALHENIESIKSIAEKENIYVDDVRNLKFKVLPDDHNTNDVADMMRMPDQKLEELTHHVPNTFDSKDSIVDNKKKKAKHKHFLDEIGDVFPVKNEETEPMVISDDSNDVVLVDHLDIPQDKDIEAKHSTEKNADVKMDDIDSDIKLNETEVNPQEVMSHEADITIDIETKNNPLNITLMKTKNELDSEGSGSKETTLKDHFRAAKFTPNKSNSVSKEIEPTSSELLKMDGYYKYGYYDIITTSFEKKLDESLSKGIAVNIRNSTTDQLSEELLKEHIMMKEEKKYQKMKEFRNILPTYKKAEDLLNVINNNQVVVISGETGCGKSTQVPQIILDDALKNKIGANVKILVTEPRRIAASSLAMRVAEERAEKMGKSVGYAVRLERVDSRPRGSIMFCTTGVLLCELETNQSLSNYSHIILDEVHERDCQVDIAMFMLKQVLQKRKDLKLILMSATIDAETLCAYFDNCPMFHIEGLAYPVQDVYLEEILHMTRYQLPPEETKKRPEQKWMKYARGRKFKDSANEMEKDIQYRAEIWPWLQSMKKTIDPDVYKTLQDHRIELLDVDLILELLICISSYEPGAILVFLPGIADITKLIKVMRESRQFPESHFQIHPLHSKLPTLTQHEIFKRPPDGVRKIIVATNIAETSITIDDVVYVVDCAKIKYKGLNVEDHVSTLQTEWASQANLRQRRGRAGRCQAGICYHLVTSHRASKLPERILPELQRDDLLEPLLQIKRLRLGAALPALSKMPAVPHTITVSRAIRHLQQCGALDLEETLTPLGWHLARLPVPPAAGKLLLLGSLFGCLERAACVAAVWGFKDPFNLVIGKEREVEEAKKNLALGEPSDHVAMSEALIQWENCETRYEKSAFARDYFLSMSTLGLLSDMKKQFGQNLKQMGFLPSGYVNSSWENRNSENLALFKAIVAAALYPNIATVRWKNLHNRNPNKQPSINVRTPEDPRVSVHPSSVMASRYDQRRNTMPLCSNPGANWLVYWLKQKSSNLYLIDVTLVYTLPLLFFGEMNITTLGETADDQCVIDIKSIHVCCNKETALLLIQLRNLLDKVLATKIMATGEVKRSSVFEEQVLNAVNRLITAEDARTDYLEDDDQSGSEDSGSGRKWY